MIARRTRIALRPGIESMEDRATPSQLAPGVVPHVATTVTLPTNPTYTSGKGGISGVTGGPAGTSNPYAV
jgi:hypothetical protein